MKIYKLIILLSFVAIFSCQSKQCIIRSVIPMDGNKVIVKKIDQCRGEIISEEENIQYSKDSFIRTGYYKGYFENGELQELGFYYKGEPDSLYIKYFPNGRKKLEYFRWHGEASGAQYSYFSNGNIESMTFCKNDSIPLFVLYFNQNGSIKKKKGSAVHLVFRSGYQSMTSGQTLNIANIICLFRNTHGIMSIQLSKNNKIIWDTTMTRFRYLGHKPYFLFQKKIKEPGVYHYSANAKIISNDKNELIKEDPETATIKVKK